jgi:hypothetical protein
MHSQHFQILMYTISSVCELVCGLPAEYCEFGPDFNRCKPWLIEHCPEIYPSLIKKEGEEGEEKGMPPPPALVEDSRYSWL